MTAYAGSALSVQWISTGGTTVLTGDFRTFTYTPTTDFIDATAGSDTFRQRIPSFSDATAKFTAVQQAGGTALVNALAEKTYGTVIVGPEGTVTGKQKMSFAAYSGGVQYSIPFDDIVEITITFQQDGARTDGNF